MQTGHDLNPFQFGVVNQLCGQRRRLFSLIFFTIPAADTSHRDRCLLIFVNMFGISLCCVHIDFDRSCNNTVEPGVGKEKMKRRMQLGTAKKLEFKCCTISIDHLISPGSGILRPGTCWTGSKTCKNKIFIFGFLQIV